MVPRQTEIAKEQERVQAIANQLWHDNSLPEQSGDTLWTHGFQHSVGLFSNQINYIFHKYHLFLDKLH